MSGATINIPKAKPNAIRIKDTLTTKGSIGAIEDINSGKYLDVLGKRCCHCLKRSS
jgi:hypothetical protein